MSYLQKTWLLKHFSMTRLEIASHELWQWTHIICQLSCLPGNGEKKRISFYYLLATGSLVLLYVMHTQYYCILWFSVIDLQRQQTLVAICTCFTLLRGPVPPPHWSSSSKQLSVCCWIQRAFPIFPSISQSCLLVSIQLGFESEGYVELFTGGQSIAT